MTQEELKEIGGFLSTLRSQLRKIESDFEDLEVDIEGVTMCPIPIAPPECIRNLEKRYNEMRDKVEAPTLTLWDFAEKMGIDDEELW